MTCPHCIASAQAGELICPHCGEILLALAPGTRLYQRYQIIKALRRDEGIAYQALDESRQEQVLLLEFFPRGSRRLGHLALLPEDAQSTLAHWVEHLHTRGRITGGRQTIQVDFQQNGTHYAVTSLPLGETLRQRVRAGQLLTGSEAQAVMLALAQELHVRHARTLVDGEISPERVTVIPGGVRLDVGWGRATWRPALAPEQVLTPAHSTTASDIYALGAVMLFALTGEPVPEVATRALGQPLPPLPPETPAPVRQAIHRSLALPAAERPDAAALVRLLGQSGSAATSAHSQTARPGVKVVQAHQGWLTHLSIGTDHIATTGTDLRLRLFDLAGHPVRALDGLDGRPVGVGFCETGLVAADQSGRVIRWEGGSVQSAQTPRRPVSFMVRPGERAVTLHDDGSLGAWELGGPTQQGDVKVQGALNAVLHVSADDIILLGTQRGQLLALDESTLFTDVWWTHSGGAPVTAIASAAGRVAVAAGREVVVLNSGNTTPLSPLPHSIGALAFSPDGMNLVAGDLKGQIHLLSLASGGADSRGASSLHQGKAPVRAVAWGEQVIAGNDLGQLLLIRLPLTE